MPRPAKRGEAALQPRGTFETNPRSTTTGTIDVAAVEERYARAIEQLAAHGAPAKTQPDQAGDTIVSARSNQPGDRHRHILCRRCRALCSRGRLSCRGLSCRY